jgi:hypothetical protein
MTEILPGSNLSYSLASFPLGNLDHASGNDGSSERGTEEVDSLVDSVALDGGCGGVEI